ncbi:MAG: mechanosensitive ion channel family protein [Alphaproteobacteria bacterium]|nr:MAG: mechanosensitive ion channel family protein [Alphaproteobacteria bacterium]
MQPLVDLYTRFATIPAERLPEAILAMAPGALVGLGFALIVLFIRDASRGFIKRRLGEGHRYQMFAKWASRCLQALGGWFVSITGLYIAIQLMPFMESIDRPAQKLYSLFIYIQLGLIATSLMTNWTQDYISSHRKTDAARATMVGSMVRIAYLLVWVVVILLLLNNFGVDVTAMVAGLGVGGLAVAFAFQNILKDIFGSFSIVFDKPFVIGDFINLGDHMGTVESIGTKTTRLRSLSGELIVISNNDLLGTRIRNYGNMYERRVVFSIRVQYGTPADKLEKIPTIITNLIKKHDDVRFDRAHLQTFTDFGLQFEVVYIVLVPDYNRMMDIQQEINLALYRSFEKEGIRFAVPIQNMLSTLEEVQDRIEEEHRPSKPFKVTNSKSKA